MTTSRKLASVTTNSNMARPLTVKIIRRASISSASPDPSRLADRLERLAFEDLTGEIVEFLQLAAP